MVPTDRILGEKERDMPFISVGTENSRDINLYYEDYGTGDPVILIHGYPLSGRAWERQIPALLDAGHRVIAYDRRGFGQSSRPWTGYDFDTFTEDLHQLVTRLELLQFSLVGHSMGGGEVARYMGKYGTRNVKKAVFISAIPPFLLKTNDNPQGIDGGVFDAIRNAVAADRPAFLAQFCADFYNADVLGGTLVSTHDVQASWNISVAASPKGTLDCVDAWLTDFRNDLSRANVPILVIHGDSDRIVPLPFSGKRMPDFVKHAKLVVIKGGPHGIVWTHSDQVNRALLGYADGFERREH
jgi:pimeloyl-ACP methyl ester carboxylesterase